MDQKDKALEIALAALEGAVATCFDQWAHEQVMSRPDHFINEAVNAIRKAKTQPEQEPVECQYGKGGYACCEGGPCKADEQNNAAQPEQEPVAVARVDDLERGGRVRALALNLSLDAPLYTTPPQRKPLTDEEIGRMYVSCKYGSVRELARAVEQAHGIKE